MLRMLFGATLHSSIVSFRRHFLFAMAAIVALLVAMIFGSVALYLWLSAGLLDPWQAAAVIAGALLVLALVLWTAGHLSVHRRRRSDDEISAIVSALLAQQSGNGSAKGSHLSAVAAAAIAGILIGRRISE